MTSSILTWIVAGVLLFWTVGAYNRLVRLRYEVNTAFGVLYAELQRQVQFVESILPTDGPQPQSGFWSSLQGAASQLAASMTVARNRPLDPPTIAALAAAGDVLAMAWDRAEREDAHDMSGPRLPGGVPASRAQLSAQVHAAVLQFNEAVQRYNTAIAQFPAMLLAWVFGFKAGRAL
ncbi:MAG TPA: LemA family protein [Ramlibacter sp.]|nr:LemA family protein [Ramlibacter sp.]